MWALPTFRCSLHCFPAACYTLCLQMAVAGGGRHLGINITWSIRWRPDGAFYEEINGKELCFKWGYDGGVHSSVWEVRACVTPPMASACESSIYVSMHRVAT